MNNFIAIAGFFLRCCITKALVHNWPDKRKRDATPKVFHNKSDSVSFMLGNKKFMYRIYHSFLLQKEF